MRYTTLRVTEAGVVLFDEHRARLAPEGEPVVAAFNHFAATALPGVFSVRAHGGALAIEKRTGSRLHNGMPARLRTSPVVHLRGPLAKEPSPCPYDAVRDPAWATLLTSADGLELLEGCTAAVVGFDGDRFVVPPDDRPRVASVTELAIRAHLPTVASPLATAAALPVALANAVQGICRVAIAGREPFPEVAAEAVAALLRQRTRRP